MTNSVCSVASRTHKPQLQLAAACVRRRSPYQLVWAAFLTVSVVCGAQSARAQAARNGLSPAQLLVVDEPGVVVSYALDGTASRQVVVQPEVHYPGTLAATDDWLYFVDDRGNGTRIQRVDLRRQGNRLPEELPLHFDWIADMAADADGRLYVLGHDYPWDQSTSRIDIVVGPPWTRRLLGVVAGSDYLPNDLTIDPQGDRLYYLVSYGSARAVWSMDRLTGANEHLEFTSEELGIPIERIDLEARTQQMYVWSGEAVYAVDLLAEPGAHTAALLATTDEAFRHMVANARTGGFCASDAEGERLVQCWALDDIEHPLVIDSGDPFGLTLTTDGERLLYGLPGSIASARIDGTDHRTVVAASMGDVVGVGVDSRRRQIYVSYRQPYGTKLASGVARTGFAGQGTEEIFSFPENDELSYYPGDIIVDSQRRRVYAQTNIYGPPGVGEEYALYAMDYRGHNVEAVPMGGYSRLALDEQTGRVCWGTETDVRCLDPNSHTITPIVDTPDWAANVGIDSERRVVYWLQPAPDTYPYEYRLYRANLDTGESQRDITPVDLSEPLMYRLRLTVDSTTGLVYVADSSHSVVWSVDSEGNDLSIVADKNDGVRDIEQMIVVPAAPGYPGREHKTDPRRANP